MREKSAGPRRRLGHRDRHGLVASRNPRGNGHPVRENAVAQQTIAHPAIQHTPCASESLHRRAQPYPNRAGTRDDSGDRREGRLPIGSTPSLKTRRIARTTWAVAPVTRHDLEAPRLSRRRGRFALLRMKCRAPQPQRRGNRCPEDSSEGCGPLRPSRDCWALMLRWRVNADSRFPCPALPGHSSYRSSSPAPRRSLGRRSARRPMPRRFRGPGCSSITACRCAPMTNPTIGSPSPPEAWHPWICGCPARSSSANPRWD